MKPSHVILIHGNGDSKPTDLWFPFLKAALEKKGLEVLAPQFPDTVLARACYWIPFLTSLKAGENTILIGHSSGAIAAMRFAEKNKILGSILIGAYYTDLGLESEKLSGYFNEPWKWDAIKNNQKWMIQFASTDDPWIPINEARFIHEKLGTEYYEDQDQGHYMNTTFPEIILSLEKKL